ncbi:HK97 family phage prohead protease [Ancylobacter sp. IITR112]|uniref:HK97 family phage prohead protease n=1 Tax=Ancylobacter sp. IITR112 TaxID=3138073 RepID=UPI00352A2D26
MELGLVGVPFEIKFASDEAPVGSFEGYGAVFGNIDSHGDVIEPGAFAKSLLDRERSGRSLPPMYKMHGAMTGNRQEPIGVWEAMSEDANGLHVKGRLVGLDTEQGKWTYAQLREGALKGLSIGYRVPPSGSRKGSGRAGEPLRYIKSALLREVSLVDDPSNVLARVYSAKMAGDDGESFADQIKTIRDFEEFLRDVGDFSHSAAKAIAAGGFKARPEPRDEDGEALKAFVEDAVKRIRGN